MTENASERFEFDDDAPYPSADRVAGRIHDGATECMHVERTAPGIYRVDSGSGNSYNVDLESGMCTCPDAPSRGPWCKHYFAVLFQTRELPTVVGTGVVADESEADDTETTEDGEAGDSEDTTDTLAERVERFEANNPDASAIEAIGQLGISPDKRERVEEVLAA